MEYDKDTLSCLHDQELLKLYAQVMDELRHRGTIRSSNNPISDYAEKVAVERLGLELVSNSNKGFDAMDAQGVKYQIKGRRITRHGSSRQLGAIRNLEGQDFDFLLALIFDEDFVLKEFWKIPHALVGKYAKYRKHVNAHILILQGPILNDPEVVSLLP